MAWTPDKHVIPAGSVVHVTWAESTYSIEVAEDLVISVTFGGPEVPGEPDEPVLPARRPGTHWTRDIPESAYRPTKEA